MTDVIRGFQTELAKGEESSSLHPSSPQGRGGRPDVPGAGAEPPAGHPLPRERQQHCGHSARHPTSWCFRSLRVPGQWDQSLISPLSTTAARLPGRPMRSCSNSAGASLQGSTLMFPCCLRHADVMLPRCCCILCSFLKHLHMQHALELKNH